MLSAAVVLPELFTFLIRTLSPIERPCGFSVMTVVVSPEIDTDAIILGLRLSVKLAKELFSPTVLVSCRTKFFEGALALAKSFGIT